MPPRPSPCGACFGPSATAPRRWSSRSLPLATRSSSRAPTDARTLFCSLMTRSIFANIAATLSLTTAAFALPPFQLNEADLARLAAEAPSALRAKIETVADKPLPSPGGDPRNYVSYARYYWPNPDQPDGLPFVSRDGQHNHEQVARGDRHRIGRFCENVARLAAAWHLRRDEAAARRAGEWLRAWFVTPATRMNPHLDYAQVRLGHHGNRGNASGVLDSRDLALVVDALRLLDDAPALTTPEREAVRTWFGEFLNWLETAPTARAERAAKNNHGSWFFAQAIPIARFAGRDDLARQLCEEAKILIAHQIRPDGAQPDEIRRVDGLGYSRFNLEAHAVIARHAAAYGIDLWNYVAPNGASLRVALEFLRPYNAAPEKWPHSQREKLPAGFLDALLREAGLLEPSRS
ncbi:MAG: hypothetical protein C0518_02805 [Opitutus sp.]|nr:hypothetical protein [Opitutus sp.]